MAALSPPGGDEAETTKNLMLDVVVIGGGIIGLAVARQLIKDYPKLSIALLEKEKRAGQGISSRNSEVIHAGLYYPEDTLKTQLCIRGREKLYQYCREHQIPYNKIGKIVLANSDTELDSLQSLYEQGNKNGIEDLQWLSRKELEQHEPAVSAGAAFLSPSTGIIDSAAFVLSLEKDLNDQGAMMALCSVVSKIIPGSKHITLQMYENNKPEEIQSVHSRVVINASGLQAIPLALTVEQIQADKIPTLILTKGNYFNYSGSNPFKHLIYPALNKQLAKNRGLGIHATTDMSGQLRFGPDAEPITNENYEVNETRRPAFIKAIKRYFPDFDQTRLQPAYAGIRPQLKLADPDHNTSLLADFMIQSDSEHGVSGLINLFGIESPGLTASLALAEEVSVRVKDCLESN